MASTPNRLHKSLLNARIGLLFYFLSLILSFFSRKIFLDYLGADFIGLTGTLINILGFLNLAEFGIGSCISFFLFKPLQSHEKDKVLEIMSVFGFLYRKIGMAIGIGGTLFSLFLPLIFGHVDFSYPLIYFAYFSFLGSSLMGYFINYRQILLTADQKNYVVSMYSQTSGIIKTLIQMGLVYIYQNLYLWVLIEFVFGIIWCVVLNWRIDKEYPWLKPAIKNGKNLLKKYPDIIVNTKQIFVHKIKDFLLGKSDEILVFAFVSLKMVAYYGNYTLIINKLNTMISTALDSVGAGVGNLVAEGNKGNIMKVFWELMAIRYYIAGVMVFSLYHLMVPFIVWWLGPQYVLSHTILILLLVNIFFMQTRGVVDMYNHAYGQYADTWAAWAEGIINLGVTLTAASRFGIAGILMGKIASISLIIVLWKPYYLFKKGLHQPIRDYWTGTLRYYLVFSLAFFVTHRLLQELPFQPEQGIQPLLLFALVSVIPFSIIYFVLLLLGGKGMKDFSKRIPALIMQFKKS